MSVFAPVRPRTSITPTLAGVTPLLLHRDDLAGGAGMWTSPQFSTSSACVALSRELSCVLVDTSGQVLSHQRIGEMGVSVHEAWNRVANRMLDTVVCNGRVEFWVRCAHHLLGPDAPRGYELRSEGLVPAGWLGHPKLFSLLHSHFTQLLRPRFGLTYASRDFRDLFIFDASASAFARAYSRVHVMRYSVGFPILESC